MFILRVLLQAGMNIMNRYEVIENHTDYISDYRAILFWKFDSLELQRGYNTCIYSLPVEIEMFRALKKISISGNKTAREKRFTIFTGDYGPAFEYYAVGITIRSDRRINEIFTECFSSIRGYSGTGSGSVPSVPLVPCFRFEKGIVIEYTDEEELAGKYRKAGPDTAGLKVQYRLWESAQGMGVRERFCG
jgi:hypothetical protein